MENLHLIRRRNMMEPMENPYEAQYSQGARGIPRRITIKILNSPYFLAIDKLAMKKRLCPIPPIAHANDRVLVKVDREYGVFVHSQVPVVRPVSTTINSPIENIKAVEFHETEIREADSDEEAEQLRNLIHGKL